MITKALLDSYIDSEAVDIDVIMEDTKDFLSKANATKKTVEGIKTPRRIQRANNLPLIIYVRSRIGRRQSMGRKEFSNKLKEWYGYSEAKEQDDIIIDIYNSQYNMKKTTFEYAVLLLALFI